jgi:hypothetical protein
MIHEFSLDQLERVSPEEAELLFPEALKALYAVEQDEFNLRVESFSFLAISNAGELWDFYSYFDVGGEDNEYAYVIDHPDRGRRWDGKQWVNETVVFPE